MAAFESRPLTGADRVAAIIDQHARAVTAPPRPKPAKQPKPRRSTMADLKREAIELARSNGWCGTTYEKAARFLRALERRQAAPPDPASRPSTGTTP